MIEVAYDSVPVSAWEARLEMFKRWRDEGRLPGNEHLNNRIKECENVLDILSHVSISMVQDRHFG